MPDNEIVFTEEQLNDTHAIAEALFDDENDPRSMSYVRKLVRPSICWGKVLLYIAIPIVAAVGIIILANQLKLGKAVTAIIVAAVLLVYFIATLKRASICLIKIYQRFAPDSVRLKCRFEPSCSEYMILAIEKYGFIKGFRKGVHRLSRCNTSGGGYDYP